MKSIEAYISSTTPDDVELRRSAPYFNFVSASVDRWNDESLPKSHFWNAISSLLPNYEYFVIQCIAKALPAIKDEKLRNEVIIFCQQEKEHAHTHNQFNESLQKIYPGIKRIENVERWCLKTLMRIVPHRFFSAIFVGVEHITSSLGEIGLDNPDLWFKNCDTNLFALWEWHAYEEVAHKAVCYDCHKALGGGYWSRVFGMLFITIFFMTPGIIARQVYMAWCCKNPESKSYWLPLLKYLFGKGGVFRESLGKITYYFSAGFSPWAVDSRGILRNYQER